MKGLPKQKYPPEFRAEEVKLVESGVSQAEAARRLGVSMTTLAGWCQLKRGQVERGRKEAYERQGPGDRAVETRGRGTQDGARNPAKSGGVLCQGKSVRYAFIQKERVNYPVRVLCRVMQVSVSGFCHWRGRPPSARSLEQTKVLIALRVAHARGRGFYGPKKLRDELLDNGLDVGINRIRRLRRKHGIYCLHKKRFRMLLPALFPTD